MGLFGFSILYLFILFAAMLAEVILRARVKPAAQACSITARLHPPSNDCDMPNPDPNVRRRNWIVLAVLVAVAVATYTSFIYKIAFG